LSEAPRVHIAARRRGGGVAARSRAQQGGKVIRIGFIGASLNSSGMMAQYQAFLTELQELGFSGGRNITVDYRRVDDPRGPFAIAAELMRLQVDLIVATGPEVALQAVVGASRSIPIVIMAVQYDPIQRGYVSSLARPGGNITGVFYRQPELAAKQLEILMQAFPERSRLAVLYDTNSADQFSAAKAGASSTSLELQPAEAREAAI
jgi:putative ABC transport system substrate-binding protein